MSGPATIFYGGVVNPISHDSYSVFPQCVLSVDSLGNIEWMVDDVKPHNLQTTLAAKGRVGAEVLALKNGEFIIPGFIDTHTVSQWKRHFEVGCIK